jgi:TPR repeat protein
LLIYSFLIASSEQELIIKAKSGDTQALYEYGLLKYTKSKYKKSLCCFEQASINGHIKAQYYVAYQNHKGLGTAQNFDDAIYWYNKAIKDNNPDALYELASIYSNQNGYKNKQKAKVYFYKAKMKGHQKAAIEYAKLAPTKIDEVKAVKNYKLGLLYYDGKTLKKNLDKALKYFKISAELGSQKAHFRLGFMYLSGIEVKKDRTASLYHLEKASFGKSKAISKKSKELIQKLELQ